MVSISRVCEIYGIDLDRVCTSADNPRTTTGMGFVEGSPKAISILLNELEAPRFKILYGYGGETGWGSVCCLLRLICMAAECKQNGLITHHSGRTMPAVEIGVALGYQAQHFEYYLQLLEKQDLIRRTNDGGVVVTDPIIERHLGAVISYPESPVD